MKKIHEFYTSKLIAVVIFDDKVAITSKPLFAEVYEMDKNTISWLESYDGMMVMIEGREFSEINIKNPHSYGDLVLIGNKTTMADFDGYPMDSIENKYNKSLADMILDRSKMNIAEIKETNQSEIYKKLCSGTFKDRLKSIAIDLKINKEKDLEKHAILYDTERKIRDLAITKKFSNNAYAVTNALNENFLLHLKHFTSEKNYKSSGIENIIASCNKAYEMITYQNPQNSELVIVHIKNEPKSKKEFTSTIRKHGFVTGHHNTKFNIGKNKDILAAVSAARKTTILNLYKTILDHRDLVFVKKISENYALFLKEKEC